MQIKTTKWYNHSPIRLAQTKKFDSTACSPECREGFPQRDAGAPTEGVRPALPPNLPEWQMPMVLDPQFNF